MTSQIDLITEANIAKAIAMDDIDDACVYLQGIAGITDGGIASICFSGFDWEEATPADRLDALYSWIDAERR